MTHQDCLEIAKNIEIDNLDKQLIILSAPKGSVLEAVEEEDGGSVLTMTSLNKGEINVYVVDLKKQEVVPQKPE